METGYIFLAVLIFLMYGITLWYSSIEGFEDGGDSEVFEDVAKIYDSTYASIYDMLWHPNEKLKYERVSIQDISLADQQTTSVKVADLCCGTAPNACWFKELGVDYTGVDISESMIEQARKACPKASFQTGNVLDVHLFPQKSKSHCLLTGFSIYEFQNPKIVSDNAYQWLKPDGYFIVHMVDPDKFDPLLDLASPFAAFSLQKYSIDRVTDSVIYFDKFKYTGKFSKKKDDDNASFDEIFSYYDKTSNNGVKYRENKHRLNMPSKERLIDIIKTSGFRHVENVDLVRCGREYQYLVYFTK
jgi:ubiquinone/menaquinone biosynthesis C-methylase UbiE